MLFARVCASLLGKLGEGVGSEAGDGHARLPAHGVSGSQRKTKPVQVHEVIGMWRILPRGILVYMSNVITCEEKMVPTQNTKQGRLEH